MAEVVVRYYGPIREIVGKRTEKVEIDDLATLLDLIEKLSDLHGRRFRSFVFESSRKMHDGLAFATDGDSISASRLDKTTCREIGEFVILPPISGGRP